MNGSREIGKIMHNYKAYDAELSKEFSDKFSMPIEVRMVNSGRLYVSAEINKILVKVPTYANIKNKDDKYGQKNYNNLMEMIKDIAKRFGHMYENIKEKQWSLSDLRRMTQNWANMMDVPMPKVVSEKVDRRWGVFTPIDETNTEIGYNRNLFFFPERLIEEVIVHELSHAKRWDDILIELGYDQALRLHNRTYNAHDQEFWKIFDQYMPDNKQRKIEMEEYWVALYKTPAPSEA